MERLILSIEKRLKEQVTDLHTIDEDYGQLETEEDTYPVLFPCALITVKDVEWTSCGNSKQMGNAIVQVTIAVDSYDDTHEASLTNDKMGDNHRIVRDCNNALVGFSGKLIPASEEGQYIDNNFTGLSRLRQSSKIIELGIKAHIFEYGVIVYDEDSVPYRTSIATPTVEIKINK